MDKRRRLFAASLTQLPLDLHMSILKWLSIEDSLMLCLTHHAFLDHIWSQDWYWEPLLLHDFVGVHFLIASQTQQTYRQLMRLRTFANTIATDLMRVVVDPKMRTSSATLVIDGIDDATLNKNFLFMDLRDYQDPDCFKLCVSFDCFSAAAQIAIPLTETCGFLIAASRQDFLYWKATHVVIGHDKASFERLCLQILRSLVILTIAYPMITFKIETDLSEEVWRRGDRMQTRPIHNILGTFCWSSNV